MKNAFYVVRDNIGEYASLDDHWTEKLADAAHFLAPAPAQAFAAEAIAGELNVFRVVYADGDGWEVLKIEKLTD